MVKYELTTESETGEPISVVVYASTPEFAVAVARGRGEVPLNQSVSVKCIQHSENGEFVCKAYPTDETSLQLELLSKIADSKLIQEPFSAIFWPVLAGLTVFSIVIGILSVLPPLGQ